MTFQKYTEVGSEHASIHQKERQRSRLDFANLCFLPHCANGMDVKLVSLSKAGLVLHYFFRIKTWLVLVLEHASIFCQTKVATQDEFDCVQNSL